MANRKIQEIEGIGPAFGEKLAAAGIGDTETLLERCCTRQGREEVAEVTGIGESSILKWANMADLFRISGVGPEFAELLEGSGVDTVKELRNRNAENLATRMAEVNEAQKLTRRVPNAQAVADFIEQAKGLPPKLEY